MCLKHVNHGKRIHTQETKLMYATGGISYERFVNKWNRTELVKIKFKQHLKTHKSTRWIKSQLCQSFWDAIDILCAMLSSHIIVLHYQIWLEAIIQWGCLSSYLLHIYCCTLFATSCWLTFPYDNWCNRLNPYSSVVSASHYTCKWWTEVLWVFFTVCLPMLSSTTLQWDIKTRGKRTPQVVCWRIPSIPWVLFNKRLRSLASEIRCASFTVWMRYFMCLWNSKQGSLSVYKASLCTATCQWIIATHTVWNWVSPPK